MQPLCETHALTKRFERVTALDRVDLTVDRPSIVGLLGKNGSGKTTLIHHLMGLQLPSEGRVETLGRRSAELGPEELMTEAKELGAPYDLVRHVAETGKLPVPNVAAGGIATPADAGLMMQLRAESVFVGSGIFKSETPATMARAIVRSATHFNDPKALADVSRGLGKAMPGIETYQLPEEELLQTRGW